VKKRAYFVDYKASICAEGTHLVMARNKEEAYRVAQDELDVADMLFEPTTTYEELVEILKVTPAEEVPIPPANPNTEDPTVPKE